MDMTTAIARVVEHLDLTTEEMAEAMHLIMTGQATDAQIGAFLISLRMKSESIDEITVAASTMRKLVTPVTIDATYLVDTCATGGARANRFNVATARTFL